LYRDLGRLLRPVILGLRSRDERGAVTHQAARQLEFWVDNLDPRYQESVLRSDGALYRDLFSALLARHTDASGDVAQLVVWGGLEESFGADWLVGGVTS
jgi:hypothetical protein